MWVGVNGGGVEKSRLKLTSAKVEVEVEAELGNISFIHWVDVPINIEKVSCIAVHILVPDP